MPFSYRETFPVAFSIIESLNFYIERVSSGARSARLFDMILGDSETVKKEIAPELEKAENFNQAQIILENAIAAVPPALLRFGQPTLDHAEKLLIIVADRYSMMSDSELRRQSGIERSLRSKLGSEPNLTY